MRRARSSLRIAVERAHALDGLVAEPTALDLGLDLHVDLLVMSRWESAATAAAGENRTAANLRLDLHGVSPCEMWMGRRELSRSRDRRCRRWCRSAPGRREAWS